MSASSLVTCLTPWPTALAWDSPQKTETTTTIETPTALAITQVVGGSMPAERRTLMEDICGWGQRDAQWEGRACTGSLAQGPHIPWRWPRSLYDQRVQLKASTEPHNTCLLLQHHSHFPQALISTTQPKCSIGGESESNRHFIRLQHSNSLSATLSQLLPHLVSFKAGAEQHKPEYAQPSQWCNHATRSLTYWVWSSRDSRTVIMQHLHSLAKWTYWSTSVTWFSAGCKTSQRCSRKKEETMALW